MGFAMRSGYHEQRAVILVKARDSPEAIMKLTRAVIMGAAAIALAKAMFITTHSDYSPTLATTVMSNKHTGRAKFVGQVVNLRRIVNPPSGVSTFFI
jgi:hypothetical protein